MPRGPVPLSPSLSCAYQSPLRQSLSIRYPYYFQAYIIVLQFQQKIKTHFSPTEELGLTLIKMTYPLLSQLTVWEYMF